jgi:hypothetical protein
VRVERSLQRKLCVDGSLMKEFVLDEPITPDFAEYLRNFGEVKTLSLMGKSFLSFEKLHFISVKGVLGEDTVEVRYAARVHDLTADLFHLLLFYYTNGREVEKVKEIEGAMWRAIRVRLEV